jgi:potassium voltage-gated channel Eag-related subfamily H protein 8
VALAASADGGDKYLINQNNTIKIFWDLFVLVLLIFISLVVPYRIPFVNQENMVWTSFYYFIDACFFIDMVLTFNCTYTHPDTMVEIRDRKKIAMNYLEGWFFLDLLAILPFDKFF